MTLSIIDLLNLIAFIVGVTGFLIFLSRWRRSDAYLFLGGFIFCYCSGAIVPVLYRSNIFEQYPSLIYWPIDLGIFALTFLFAFLKRLSGTYEVKTMRFLFAIPILVSISQFYFWSMPQDIKIHHLDDGTWRSVLSVYRIISYVFTLTMIAVTLITVRKYEKQVDQFYSEGLPKGFSWVKTICYYVILLLVATLIPSSVMSENAFFMMSRILTAINICLILWLIIEGLNQDYLYVPSGFDENTTSEKTAAESEITASSLLDDIVLKIENQQLYRSVDLNLNDLAVSLHISPRKLSNLINRQTNKNFRNFINSFRIQFAKEQLTKGVLDSMNMNGLARDAGFKSRTTFYTAFKSEVGCTPIEFLKGKSPQ